MGATPATACVPHCDIMKARVVSSPHNPRFKSLTKLLKTAGIRKQGRALVSGARQVKEILRDCPERCEAVLLPEKDVLETNDIPESVHRLRFASELFRVLDAYGTSGPILVVRTGTLPVWGEGLRSGGCTLLVPFQDPANVGAVLRSAAAFGVGCVVLLQEAAFPFHPKAARVAGSALFRVHMEMGPSIYDLKDVPQPIIALAAGGCDLRTFSFPGTFALLPGLEGPGLPGALPVHARIGIPMAPGMDSLNAALATGIALYQWRSQTPWSGPL